MGPLPRQLSQVAFGREPQLLATWALPKGCGSWHPKASVLGGHGHFCNLSEATRPHFCRLLQARQANPCVTSGRGSFKAVHIRVIGATLEVGHPQRKGLTQYSIPWLLVYAGDTVVTQDTNPEPGVT